MREGECPRESGGVVRKIVARPAWLERQAQAAAIVPFAGAPRRT
jgi:hypothetical protein